MGLDSLFVDIQNINQQDPICRDLKCLTAMETHGCILYT